MSTHISSTQLTEMRHMRPYVHYHCSCPDLLKPDNDNEEVGVASEILGVSTEKTETETTTDTTKTVTTLPPFNINSSRFHFTTFSISKLYFCDDCHQIRCPRCVQEEIVCYYCPNCLFEVPTASVKSERNRCARNCFQCPICQNTLSVMPTIEPIPPSQPSSATTAISTTTAGSTPTSGTAPAPIISGAPYYLSCGVCRWDSQEIGMTFEKATGLALQLQKTEDERPDVKEFEHLKEHFEKHLRHNTPATTLPPSLMSIPGINGGGFSSRYGGGAIAGGSQQKSDDLAPYDAVVKVENESVLVDDLVQLRSVNQITTLMQRMNQLSDQPYKVERLQPQRIHLRTKRIKRCRQCRHILIKPEQKAQATRFKIKLVALAYVPKITIMSLPKLIVNQTTQIVLKFSNPLYEEITLDLSVQDVELGKIKVLAPHFSIAPYNEVWEYDEQDLVSSKSRSNTPVSSAPRSDIGIYEKKSNSTSIMLEITPEVEVEEFKFALLVTYTSKAIDNNNSESTIVSANIKNTKSDDKDPGNGMTKTDVTESETNNPVTKTEDDSNEKTKNEYITSPNNNEQEMKSLSFWTVIGLGPVVKSSPSSRHTISGSSGTSGSISLSHNLNVKLRPQSQS